MDNNSVFSEDLREYFPGIFGPLVEVGGSLADVIDPDKSVTDVARSLTRDFQANGPALIEIIERLRRDETVIPPLFNKAYMHAYSELPNRMFFNETATEELKRFNAGESQGASVILMDVDKLHAVNKRFGYQTGDEFLKIAAAHIREQIQSHVDIPDNNVVAHFGGDEFAVLITNETEETAQAIADVLRKSFEDLSFDAPDDQEIPIRLSMGITPAMKGDEFSTIMHRADIALREDKNVRQVERDDLEIALSN